MKTYKRVGLVALSLLLTLTVPFTALATGKGSDGGLYKYFNTSYKHIRGVKNFLANAVIDEDQAALQQLARRYNTEINWKEFSEILHKDLDIYEKSIETVNPHQSFDLKIMDYGRESKTIKMSLEYLQMLHKNELSAAETSQLMHDLLHEISHIFGIGTDKGIRDSNNDSQSKRFAKDLASLLVMAFPRCFKEEDMQKTIPAYLAIQSCEDYKTRENALPTKVKETLVVKAEYNNCRFSSAKRSRLNSDLKTYSAIQKPLPFTWGPAGILVELDNLETGEILHIRLSCIINTKTIDTVEVQFFNETAEMVNSERMKLDKLDKDLMINVGFGEWGFWKTDGGLKISN